MSRRKVTDAAFAKALGLWEPPDGAGEARVCIASTYTFDAAFFETECLGRFLGMDSHPTESDAVSYMVEREEKLAAARITVLADRRNASDKESLRWDVLGILVPDAIQHSKISLLAWANYVRVIIGSGNLTEPGYRKNLEVFGTLYLSRTDGGSRDAVLRILDFLNDVVEFAVGTETPGAPKVRARAALNSVRTLITRWADTQARYPVLILGGPGRSILSQLAEAWPSVSPPRTAHVVSPFFDSNGQVSGSALLGVMAKRRPREIFFDVRTESGPDGRTRVFAPLPMVKLLAGHTDVAVHRVLPEQRGELRDLHAKMIHLSNEDWCLAMIGSSNFTSAGLGTGSRANFEANLAYGLRVSDSEAKVLDAVWPDVDGVPLDIGSEALIWDPQGEEDGEDGDAPIPLPAGFEEASFVPGKPASLVITLRNPLPVSWTIQAEGGRELLSSEFGAGTGEHAIAWHGAEVPFVLTVTWKHNGETAAARWPVNVSDPGALPPPEALRSLTLEELLLVIASTRPIPQAVAQVLARRKHKNGVDVELDPLKRFDSQSFLLRRTKRLATALERLRERLERPASSREVYEWRLFGPVGPVALAEGYIREASFAGEAKFCLAEIALILRRVQADKVAVDGLPRAVVGQLLKKAIQELAEQAAKIAAAQDINLYAVAAFAEAAR